MVTTEDVVLWVHIAAGAVALAAGFVALVTTKGSRRHRRAGRVYVIVTIVLVGLVVALLWLRPSSSLRRFFTILAVLTGYLAISGYRAIVRQRVDATPGMVDVLVALLVVVASLGLGSLGIEPLRAGSTVGAGQMVVGMLVAMVALSDVRTFWNGEQCTPVIVDHLERMVGSYITTATAAAFFTVGVTRPGLAWIGPAAVGIPLTWYWQRKYGDAGPLARVLPW